MRVLFTTFPGNTHFFNSVPLAWALVLAGHEVRVASAPELTETITRSGLSAVPVGSAETLQQKTLRVMRERGFSSIGQWMGLENPGDLHLAEDRGDELTWEDLRRVHQAVLVPAARIANDSMIDDLVAYSRWWRPDLVLWDAVSYAGSVAATAAGAAHARILYSHDTDARMRKSYLRLKAQQPPDERTDPMAEWLGERIGDQGGEFSEDLVNGHFTIDQLPESFRLDTGLRHLSLRYVPYNGPAVVPQWLWDDPPRPRVLLTFGVSSRDWTHMQVMPVDRMGKVLAALADLDVELVVTLPDRLRAELGDVPSNTRIVDFVPLQAAVQSCAAVVHHGGAGSFNVPLLYGVPQILVSKVPDSLLKARRLRETGAGLWIDPDTITGEQIRDAVSRVLVEPSFQAGAQAIRQEILAQPSPHDTVPELERLAAEYRR
ncbi:activator-dependent family glycosyltransferase [Actinomadura macra]|uniref:activator-dependent family glycosyltransferase n=1 Tax=Actinomadura macra TaxID=46164 RepID=UPI0008308EAA|nr:activator-dependent family glycosyltransferase [Actinomadura macra]